MTARPKVVITDLGKLFPSEILSAYERNGIDVIDADAVGADKRELIEDAAGLVVFWFPITADVIAGLSCCRHVQRVAIGFDNVDVVAARTKGISVSNVPDYCINEVADHALAMALSLQRQLPTLDAAVRANAWPPLPPRTMPALNSLTFGTLGLGRIGKEAQARAAAFGMRRIAHDPYIDRSPFDSAHVVSVELDALLAESDILSLHVPLTGKTRGLVNAVRLGRMKPTAILINTARGPVVDTVALADALTNGRLAAAGIDVMETEPLEPDHPLRAAPNVILTPHIAWHSAQSGPKLLRMSVEESIRGVLGEPLRSCVN